MQLHGQLAKLIKSMASSLEQLTNLAHKTALQQQHVRWFHKKQLNSDVHCGAKKCTILFLQ